MVRCLGYGSRFSFQSAVAVALDAAPTSAEPVEPGTDIGLKVLAPAGRAGLALDLPDDAAHGMAPGQEHGVDDRSEGLVLYGSA